ncbi:slit homolog 2 protein-like [Mya arenaria]|uniref:slit homolog 2 protein-like n=1 Tax=Mya arenaria TaxID=6604 RepID=UPI0022E4C020|nr:slit homolog 2 protein-like [Mya arenaria]
MNSGLSPLLLLLFAVVGIRNTLGVGVCPQGCYCDKQFVDCSALMKFPTNLPDDTTRFRSQLMNVLTIPPKAFSYLKNISKIEINQGNIGTIQSCAFADLPSVKQLLFEKAVIGNVESYAFNGLTEVDKIEFTNSRIGRLKPFGFSDIESLGMLSFINTNIPNFYSHGLYNIREVSTLYFKKNNVSDMVTGALTDIKNISNAEVTSNTFWNMHCGNLDTLFSMGRNVMFEDNQFYCNCSVNYILNTVGRVKYGVILPKNKCHGPKALVEKNTLWHVFFHELGCRNQDPSTALPCTQIKLNFNPRCALIPSTRGSKEDFGDMHDHDHDDEHPKGNGNALQALGTTMIILLLSIFMLKC